MTTTNEHWSRAHQLGDTTRKLLATANTGGIGILLALAGSLAADGVSPGWAVPAVAAFSLGVIFVVAGFLFAQHRVIAQAKAADAQYPEFPIWKTGIAWNLAGLVCLLIGAFLGIRGLDAVQVPAADESDQEEPAQAVHTTQPATDALPDRYGAIIDAGSSGSRLWIFKWSIDAQGDPVIDKVENLKGKTAAGDDCPLTNMIDDEQGTCTCLTDLVTQGHQKLASAAGAAPTAIPLWVKATGGVRKAPMQKQIDILDKTNRCLAKSEPAYKWRGAEAIAGSTEALYAWLAVNYAHQTLKANAQTYGIVEIGGESAQIAFKVPAAIAPAQRGSVIAVPLSSGTVHVYSHSDVLGKEAVGRALDHDKVSARACELDGDVKKCRLAIDEFLCPSPHKGKPCEHRNPEFVPGKISFIGLSNFKHIVFNSGFDAGSLLDVEKRAETMCGPGAAKAALRDRFIRAKLPADYKKAVCLDALYTSRVAEYAWEVPPADVSPAGAGLDPDWPLGAMFLEIARRSGRDAL